MNVATLFVGSLQTKANRLLYEHASEVLTQYELTPTNWSMLCIVAGSRDGIRHAEVAQKLHVKAPLITVMARDLERLGLIHGVRNQFDSRAKLLASTASGKQLVKVVQAALEKRLDGLLAGLSVADLNSYRHVLLTIEINDALHRGDARADP